MLLNKRLLSVLLIASMLLATVSCGRNAEQGYYNPKAEEIIDFSKKPTTITYLTIGNKPTNGMTEKAIEQLNVILERELNARLDIYYVGWTDYLQNYNAILNSEDVNVDLIGTGADWLDAWPNVINGNFMPLSEEMLRIYCGITYTNVTAAQWESCKYNGDVYLIPENEYTQWTNHGFVYRKDLAEEAGLNGIKSWKDLDTYFNYVVDNHPEMIPWDAEGAGNIATLGYLMSAQNYVPIYELSTYGIWGEDKEKEGKIICPYYTGTDFVEFAKLMKKWNEMGVWRRDQAVGDNEEEFYRGESSVIQHHTEQFYTIIQPTMSTTMPDVKLDFFWFGQENGNIMKVSNIHGAMAVSARSENPELALMVYDMIRNNEQCYRLMRFGIEGVQYEINQEGMLEKPSGYNEALDGIVTDFWWGRRDIYEIPNASYDWEDYYNLVDVYNRLAIDYPWEGIPFSTPTINSEVLTITEIFDKYIPVIASGRYSGSAEDKVKEFREELKKAGIERITGHLQRIYDNS